MVPSRRRAVRLTRSLLVVVVALGLIHTLGARGDVDRARPGLAPGTTAPSLFHDQMLVQGIHGFTPAEVRTIDAAVSGTPLVLTDGETYVVRGTGAYNELPLSTVVADPVAYAAAAGRHDLVRALRTGAVVSASAAKLFAFRVGDILRVASGGTAAITAIVDDHVVSGYQLALARGTPAATQLGSHADSVMVTTSSDTRPAAQRAIRAALPSRRLAFITPTPTAYFSTYWDVLSQSQLQAKFGVFRVRQTSSGFVPDPSWVSAHITQRRVVQLGTVVCNRTVMAPLVAAMTEITDKGLGKTIDTADFIRQGGCWNPRTTRLGNGMLSHHAWGIAIDINVGRNPLGAVSRQDSRLVAIMAKHGFTWGGRWLRHDAAHFEWVGSTA